MAVKDTIFSKKRGMNISGQLIDLTIPKIMAIVNVTPDSFYKGSRSEDIEIILKNVKKHIDDGADIVDVGAYSSRPGAENIPESAEKERLKNVFYAIRKTFPNAILSIDTFRASVAEWAVGEFGVGLVNDISGGKLDENMIPTIARIRVPYVLMHMRGNPQNMQSQSEYKNVTKEVIKELSLQIEILHRYGIPDIIIDPGFGFSKTIDQNYQLLRDLYMFKIFEKPILVGLSRKSMIYKVLNSTPEESLIGTAVLNTVALLNGANILRVHDVKETIEVIKIAQKCK